MAGDSECLPSFRIFQPIRTSRLTRVHLTLIIGLLSMLSSGCTSLGDYVRNGFKVGPNYEKPKAPVANEWIDSKSTGVNVATKDLAEWWTEFKDPKLNDLVAEAYKQNLTLRSAGTRILAAAGTAQYCRGEPLRADAAGIFRPQSQPGQRQRREPAQQALLQRHGDRVQSLLGTRFLGTFSPRRGSRQCRPRRLHRKL